jgi:RimJ/RimL family protein N-acetyltransferase
MLVFTSIFQHKAGTIASLLLQSYVELLTDRHWEEEREKWLEFEREVFEKPETVGKCAFITCSQDKIVGFDSFDPRQKPEFGIIGHNCILPEFRGNGYGKQQIREMLNRLRAMGIKKVIVSTSEHPFFLAAQRMYLSCGFQEKRKYTGGPDPRYRLIEYERDL